MVKQFNRNFRVGQGGLVVVTADTTILSTNKPRMVLVDATAGPVTVTLPLASGIGGKRTCIVKTDASANVVTIAANAADTVNGVATDSVSNQFENVDYISDNENSWLKVAVGTGGGGGGLPLQFPNSVPVTRSLLYEEFYWIGINAPGVGLRSKYAEVGQWQVSNTHFKDGILQCQTGLSAGDAAGLNTEGSSFRFDTVVNTEAQFRAGMVESSLASLMGWIGFLEDIPDEEDNIVDAESTFAEGAFFRYDSGVANWQAVTKNTGTETVVDTGVAVVLDSLVDFEIRLNGTDAVFFINGSQVASINTNYPSGTLLAVLHIGNKIADQRELDIDSIHILSDK